MHFGETIQIPFENFLAKFYVFRYAQTYCFFYALSRLRGHNSPYAR